MFGISLTKILFTIFMVFAVFWVYRQINLLADGKSSAKESSKSKKSSDKGQAQTPPSSDQVEELTACPACGAYVAAGSNPGCGRPAKECPMQT